MSTLAFTDTFDLLLSDFAPGFVVAVVPATVVAVAPGTVVAVASATVVAVVAGTVVAVASTTVVAGSAAFLVRAIDEPACVSEPEEQAPMTRHRAVRAEMRRIWRDMTVSL
ncbi:MAG: hypothetical protein JHC86_00950 [Ilumatobacteraceae bacterium]|nr:hypothetical protein [Ilumatobacteraceae bacterium]